MDKSLLNALRIFKERVNKRHLNEICEKEKKKHHRTKMEIMKFNSRLNVIFSYEYVAEMSVNCLFIKLKNPLFL